MPHRETRRSRIPSQIDLSSPPAAARSSSSAARSAMARTRREPAAHPICCLDAYRRSRMAPCSGRSPAEIREQGCRHSAICLHQYAGSWCCTCVHSRRYDESLHASGRPNDADDRTCRVSPGSTSSVLAVGRRGVDSLSTEARGSNRRSRTMLYAAAVKIGRASCRERV